MDAFNRLIGIHQDRVYNVALRLMNDPEDALDISQEALCALFRKIQSFRGDASLSTWLYRITVNTAKNFWKMRERRGYYKTVSLDHPVNPHEEKSSPMEIADSNPGPVQKTAGREMVSILEEKLGELSLEHREILVLRYTEGLSYEEIAEILGDNLGTIKSRLNRARAELKDLMEPYMEL
ncbi:sigma-70 family RNA polymerase sigma factor [Candidatus Sumerlaeota bacterium]|nr:sigma-70 family RNA polymerase sigma factor [Candidatus Sumerlaeota bacterium]